MDAKLGFWCLALLNMSVLVTFIARGVMQIRRGEVAAHKRSMITATSLVGLFLVSYLLKASLLGKEDLSVWSEFHVWNLRIHESFVLMMLLAGGFAIWRASKMAGMRNVTKNREDPLAPETLVRLHTRAGWTAVVSAALGLATAAVVLAGMLGRANLG
ncbi:MAG: DUF420 domain-containing protein [Myxococcota bacterium]|nr:DUF420 domain-containing protein [Myxococcota bacterium]